MSNLWDIEVEDDGYDGSYLDEDEKLTPAEISKITSFGKWTEEDDLETI